MRLLIQSTYSAEDDHGTQDDHSTQYSVIHGLIWMAEITQNSTFYSN